MSSRTWFLTDVGPVAAKKKYTFYKPSAAAIDRIAPGDTVKLIFEFSSDDPAVPEAERMWVLVDEVVAPGRFRGRLDNDPYHIKGLKAGDPVEFEACNIIQTPHDPADDLPGRYRARCFVTSRVLYDGAPVGYLLREEPDQDNDSGWRFFANDESDDYFDTPENLHFVALGAVLNCDDTFIGLLDSPLGSAFLRDEATGQFVVPDEA